jgi:hypothetical protein
MVTKRIHILAAVVSVFLSHLAAQTGVTPVTKEYAQNVIAGLKQEIERENQRLQILARAIYVKTGDAGTDIFNVYLGQLFGRADVYEKLTQTIDQANQAFSAGNRTQGVKLTYDALTQFKDLAQKTNGLLNPEPYQGQPEGILERLRQFRDDTTSLLKNLGSVGDAMGAHDESIRKLAALKGQLADWQTQLNNASPSMGEKKPDGPPVTPLLQPPPPPEPRRTDYSELDDAVLVNRWRDLGNRAFSNKAEEDAFYRRHPEYLKYRKTAELRSPADDVDRDSVKPKDKQSQIQNCQATMSSCSKGCSSKDPGTVGALIAAMQAEARCVQRCAASNDSCLASVK